MFSYFYEDYISHQLLEYITPFLISPVLFLFPSSHLISTFFFFTFANSSNHSPLSIFLRASVSTFLMQFRLAFTLFAKENSSSSSKLLPIFKILGPLIQILSGNTVKTVYRVFLLLLPKRHPHFQVQLLRCLSLLPENLPFFNFNSYHKGLIFPISQRYCIQFP